MDQIDAFSLRDGLIILFRRLGGIVLVLLTALAMASAYLAVTPKEYSAVTRVLIGLGREKFEDLGMQTQPVGNLVFQEREQNINNEVEILKDPTLLMHALPTIKARLSKEKKAPARLTWISDLRHAAANAAQHAGLLKNPDPETALAIKLYNSLTISAVKATDIIDVGFTWTDPVVAADVLNIYLAEYQQQHLRVYETKRSVVFFQQELAKAQSDLQAVDGQQTAFLKKTNVSNFDVEKTQLLAELSNLRTQAENARLDSDVSQIKPQANATASGDAAIDQTILQLQTERRSLLLRFELEAQPVRDIDDQIAHLRSQKAQSVGAVYRGHAASQAARLAGLNAQIATKEATLRGLTASNADYDAIQRRRTAASSLVEEYRRKLEDLQVSSALNANAFSSVRLLSDAVPPVVPSAPKPLLLIGLAAGFGLMAGIAYAVAAESLNRTFQRAGQVRQFLSVPVLAAVPELPAPGKA